MAADIIFSYIEEEQKAVLCRYNKQMISSNKYRATGLTLAVVFAVFNIGLPIVVASCPMMDGRGAACCAMNDEQTTGAVKFTQSVDRSCCVTRFAADRNKIEFLETAAQKNLPLHLVAPSVLVVLEIPRPGFGLVTSDGVSPPRVVDIPILVSSLLI